MKDADVVWEAERLINACRLVSPLHNPQAWVDGVRASKFVKNRWPSASKRRVVVIESNHQNAWSTRDETPWKIWLPPWAMTDVVASHELAHLLSGDRSHGVRFRRCEHELLGRFVSVEAARCFRYTVKAIGASI